MVLFEDVRNKPGKHKNIYQYCQHNGIEIIRQCLNVGDYMIANRGDIVCDTKMSVIELAGNIFQDHERFRAECERAQRCEIKLLVLVEEVLPKGGLVNWRSPMGKDGLPLVKFDPVRLRKAMLTMQDKYGCIFRFCDGRSTARTMIEYLKGERVL